jgi:hypothetical protein
MNNDTHKWFESLIETYLADGLSEKESAEFESHRDGCAECRKSLNEAQRFESVLFQALAMDKSPIDIAGRVSAAIALKQPNPLAMNIWDMIRGLNPLKMPRYITGPAVAAIIVLIGMMVAISTNYEKRYAQTKTQAGVLYEVAKAPPSASEAVEDSNKNGVLYGYTARGLTVGENRPVHWTTTGSVSPVKIEYSSDKATEAKDSSGAYSWTVNNGVTTTSAESPQPPPPTPPPTGDIAEKVRTLTILPETPERLEEVTNTIQNQLTDVRSTVRSEVEGQLAKETSGELIVGEPLERNLRVIMGASGAGQGTLGKLIPAPLAAGAPIAPDRKVIKSGTLTFEVDSFEATYQRVIAVLIEEKGYVASSQSSKLPNGKVQGEIVIRMLPERFDTVVLKLRNLGELKNQQVSAEDITKQFIDLQARLKNTQALEERLVKLMDRKGEMKDLLTVEKELANTREKIEQLQGELKYYDNLVALSTIRLIIAEKDIAKPFEYVQTQSAALVLTVADVITAYQRAQAIILGLNGQVIEAQVTNQDKRVIGIVKAYTDADQFTGLLEQLKGLGEVRSAVSEQRQSAPQGASGADKNTPVRKERGLVSISLNLPVGEYIQTQQARIALESSDVDSVYAKVQEMAQGMQAKVLSGNINRGTDQTVATVVCQAPAEHFRSLVESLKGIAKVKSATMDERQSAQGIDPRSLIPAPVRKEPGIIELTIASPTAIVTEEQGFWATLRNTLKGSISGLLWSLEMLVVGLVTIGPWLVLLALVVILIKRWTVRKDTGKS